MKKIGLTFALFVAAFSPLVVARSQGDEMNTKAEASQIAQAAQNEERLAPQASKEAQDNFNIAMSALETDDLAAFVSHGEPAFAMALTKSAFSKISAQVAPRLEKGYQSAFLCRMKQRGYDVFLWKVSFKDDGDDLLASLSLKNGKVGGFFLN